MTVHDDAHPGGTRDHTTPPAWPTGPVAAIRTAYARVRAWVCARVCDGYDRRAGRIVDAAIAARDAAVDDAARTHGGDV